MFRISEIGVDSSKLLPLSGFLVLEQDEKEASPLIDRLIVAATSAMQVRALDLFYVAASMPRSRPSLHIHEALARTGIPAGHIVEFGYNCASILDALSFCVGT